ncbi:MAG: malonyl-ACP O-methyltransferase BioC [Gammaproteobacteria bacterium]|nr:malonyl-ACP O-methyltransferase BioC [Gammaproteobacteria bacterium]
MTDDYQVSHRAVRHSFDQAAAAYDEAAVLQREVADRLLERLELVRLAPRRILDAGSGTGYVSTAIARRYPKAQIIALDLAHGMVCRARARFGFIARRLRHHGFVCADVERLPLAAGSVDLIVSNLALQWCNPLDVVFAEFRRVLAPGGLLMFTTFGPDTLKELRASWAAADGAVHVNAFIDMHDVGDALVQARLADPVMEREEIAVTYPRVEGLLRDLKAIGAHNMNAGRARGLTGRRRFAAMRDAYEGFRRDDRLPATYEVIYGHAWAPTVAEPTRAASGEVRIPLLDVKSGLRRGKP